MFGIVFTTVQFLGPIFYVKSICFFVRNKKSAVFVMTLASILGDYNRNFREITFSKTFDFCCHLKYETLLHKYVFFFYYFFFSKLLFLVLSFNLCTILTHCTVRFSLQVFSSFLNSTYLAHTSNNCKIAFDPDTLLSAKCVYVLLTTCNFAFKFVKPFSTLALDVKL